MYRLICSLLVVLVCAGGYFAFDRTKETTPAASDDIVAPSTSVQSAPAAPSDDLPQININQK